MLEYQVGEVSCMFSFYCEDSIISAISLQELHIDLHELHIDILVLRQINYSFGLAS